jgi:hypothetical protein
MDAMDEADTNERFEAIRRRAYELWELEGRPDGRDRIHWLEAERELTLEREPVMLGHRTHPAQPRAIESKLDARPERRAWIEISPRFADAPARRREQSTVTPP